MRPSRIIFAVLCTAILGAASAAFAQKPTPLLTRSADEWIAVLKSDAPHKDKVDACRQLSVIGGTDAVPVLAALLPDPQMNHMARYALETIPHASAGQALREALTTLQGRPLAGVIASVGVRKDPQGVEPLAKLLQHTDAEVAQAAGRALGAIATPAAAEALKRAIANGSGANQLAFSEGLLRSAEAFLAKGESQRAIAIYDDLRKLDAPQHVRVAAVKGAILARRDAGVPILREQLLANDYVLFAAAINAAYQMPGADVTKTLAAALPKLPTDDQRILVIQALGKRNDKAAVQALAAASESGSKPVRVVALQALAETGNASAAPVLAELLREKDRELSQAAMDSLAGLPGKEADSAVLSMLKGQDTTQRLAAIELIGRRRMSGSLPELIKVAAGPEAEIRPAALRRVGELGTPAEVPTVLDLLPQLTTEDDLDAVEQALSSLCAKSDRPEACAEKITPRLDQAQPAQKGMLLRVLSSVGGPKALEVMRTAIKDANPEVHAAAIRALGAWRTADAAPDLLALANDASNPTDRTLSLRSFLNLASNQDLPATERLALCRQAAGVVKGPDEKRLLLSALGSIDSPDAIALITPHLDDPDIRGEAGAAVLSISERMLKGQRANQAAGQLVQPLQKVAETASNENQAKRAKTLLEQAKKRAKTP